MEEVYTPQYGDELVMKRGHVFKMLTWTYGIIQGKYEDYWEWHAWSDTEDFIRERIHDMGLVKGRTIGGHLTFLKLLGIIVK